MFIGYIDISRLLVYVKHVEEEKMRNREEYRDKKSNTGMNQGSRRSMPTAIFSSRNRRDVLYHLLGHMHFNKGEYNNQIFRVKPTYSKGTMVQGGSKPLACAKCGRNHSSSCRDGSAVYFKCGQNGNFMQDSPKKRYGNGNGGNRAQSSSIAPPDRATPRRATSGMPEGQTASMQSLAAMIKITLPMLS